MAEPMPSPRRARSAEPQGMQASPQPVPGRADPCGGSQGLVPQDPAALSASPGQGLTIRRGGDGSFSLWSEAFREGFHSGRGARREARETFLEPSQLERFPPGRTIRVLEVCVGTGCNLAVLLEACAAVGLRLEWIGLELDPEPLRLALGDPAFRASWPPATLTVLQELQQQGRWQSAVSRDPGGDRLAARLAAAPSAHVGTDGVDPGCVSHGRILWGDARQTLRQLQAQTAAPFDLIWHDAFSPQRCPQLWSLEFLRDLTGLLRPAGRWISYSSAAAVREALLLSGLQLAALQLQPDAVSHARNWSGGTVASCSALPSSALWRALTPMEQDHLACSAGEPYRDPCGSASAERILAARQEAQAVALASGRRGSSSSWRRRWGVER